MKPVNKEIVLGISDLLPNGEGIAEIDGRRVQVRNALTGELVRARILKKKKGIKFISKPTLSSEKFAKVCF